MGKKSNRRRKKEEYRDDEFEFGNPVHEQITGNNSPRQVRRDGDPFDCEDSRSGSRTPSPSLSNLASTDESNELNLDSELGQMRSAPENGDNEHLGRDSLPSSPGDPPSCVASTQPGVHGEKALAEIGKPIEAHDFKRKRLAYCIIMVVLMGMFVGYSAVFLLNAYMYYLLPNAIIAVAVSVSFVIPAVIYLGMTGAYEQSLGKLQAFGFMMVSAVTLQLSVCLLMILDSGVLADALLQAIAVTMNRACAHRKDMPVGADLLPVDGLCTCADAAVALIGSSSASESGIDMEDIVSSLGQRNGDGAETLTRSFFDDTEDPVLWECIKTVLTDAFNLTGSELTLFAVITLALELVVAHMAYNLMANMHVREYKKRLKQKGGPQIAVIHGAINDGTELGSGHKAAKGTRKDNYSSRYAVLCVNNPEVEIQKHRVQKVITGIVEDDADPEWGHEFDNIAVYRDSSKLTLEVFAQVSDSKSDVLVGFASPDLSSTSKFLRMKDGVLVDYEYIMDGEDEVEVDLFIETGKGKKKQKAAAGSVSLKLIYAPTPDAAGSAATVALTQSWYFEFTVLFMVLLSMVGLALSSPAFPPSPALYGALRVIELFVATHMSVEILMDMYSSYSQQNEKFWQETWFQMAAFVLFCNWAVILFPRGFFGGAKFEKFLSVGRVLRILRPMRTFRMVKHVDIILRVIWGSMGLFCTVCMLVVFLLAIFALIGSSSFSGALQYECIKTNGAKPICSDKQLAAARLKGIADEDCPLPCPSSLLCAETYDWCAPLEEPRQVGYDTFGYRDFDTFWRGFASAFVQTTGDGGISAIPIALYQAGAADIGRAWVISFCTSVFLNVLALNLFLAVCCSAYSDVASETHDVMEHVHQLEESIRQEMIRQETPEERDIRLDREWQEREANKTVEERVHEKNWLEDSRKWGRFRDAVKRIILSETFDTVTCGVIIGNTVTMAMSGPDVPFVDENITKVLAICETLFLCTYIIEASMKFIGEGKTLYFLSLQNRFDLFVILASVVGFFATFFEDEIAQFVDLEAIGGLQVLRAVRLLRTLQILRLLHRQKALILVMKTIFSAWKPLVIHSIFCLFSICVIAIIGMHMFGGSLGKGATLKEYEESLPEHFETFANGVLTTFEMTVGEEWSMSMYWYLKHAGDAYNYPPAVITLYFSGSLVWMNCILFSLYVAMLLENFNEKESAKLQLQKQAHDRKARKRRRALLNIKHSLITHTIKEDLDKGHSKNSGAAIVSMLLHSASLAENPDARYNKSLNMFKLDNKFRLTCAYIQEHPQFQRTITILIIFSCASLAAEGRGEAVESQNWIQDNVPHVFGKDVFWWVNILVLLAFTVEAGFKMVIHGFLFSSGPTHAYLQSRMNQLDFIIVILCIAVYLPFVPIAGPWARALRVGRVITPMMNLSKNPDIALVILSFVRAIPDTGIVLLPLVLLMLVFSIVGVQWFGGATTYCIADIDPLVSLQISTKSACENMTTSPHSWVSPKFSFDNTLVGMATLMLGFTDGTHGFMMRIQSTQSIAFWVAFHLVFTCFFLNLFLGVLTASFEKSSGSATMMMGEKQWKATQKMLRHFDTSHTEIEEMRPPRRDPLWWWKVRNRMFDWTFNEKLEQLWAYTIAVNTMTLASDRYPISLIHAELIEYLNITCLVICAAEVVIKMIGLNPKRYLSSGWRVSDFLLVSVSVGLRVSGSKSGVETLRVVRVFRLVVLASKIPSLVALIDIVVSCLRASFAVILLTCLTVYLYAIVGMAMFGALPTDDVLSGLGIDESNWKQLRRSEDLLKSVCPACGNYDDFTNFNDFPAAFRLLVQIMFGQGIAGMVVELNYLGAPFWTTFLYFVSFYILTVWVFLNLLIVTVLANFDEANTGVSDDDPILPNDIDGFAHTWAALTIGAHSSITGQKVQNNLDQHLANHLEQVEENLEHGVESASFEDGNPELCGQLTFVIQRMDGCDSSWVPYAAVRATGSNDKKNQQTHQTAAVPVRGGIAVWNNCDFERTDTDLPRSHGDESPGQNLAGETLKFHLTAHVDHVTIDIRDSYQFSDQRIGAAYLNADKLRQMTEFTSLDLELRTDLPPQTNSAEGSPDHWFRYRADSHNHEQEAGEDVDETEPIPTEEMEKLKQQLAAAPVVAKKTNKEIKAEKKKAKRQNKMGKRAGKREKKAKKKKAKENKRRAKKGLPLLDDTDDEEEVKIDLDESMLHKMEQWPVSGATLHITVLFEQGILETETMSFMQDHSVNFARKEGNAGSEGWLSISESETAHFYNRFCYIQSAPEPCLKICEEAADTMALEELSSRSSLKVQKILAKDILAIQSGFDSQRGRKASMLNKTEASFQLAFDHEQTNGLMQEGKVGKLMGLVVKASGLVKPVTKGVQLVERIKIPEFPPEETANEHPDGEDAGNLFCALLDDEMQEEIEQVRYIAMKKLVLRTGVDLESDECGHLMKSEICTVTHTAKLENGMRRLRTLRGWVSATNKAGSVTMIMENETKPMYRVKRDCQVIGRQVPALILKKNHIVEVVNTKAASENESARFQIDEVVGECQGWISEIDYHATADLDLFCSVEVVRGPTSTISPPTSARKGNTRREQEVRVIQREQSFKTQTVRPTYPSEQKLQAEWGFTAFDFDVLTSTTKLRFSIHDDTSAEELGFVELNLGTDNIPGPQLSNSEGRVELGDGAARNQYEPMNEDKLRQILKKRGLQQTGTKEDLIARLLRADEFVDLKKQCKDKGLSGAGGIEDLRERLKHSNEDEGLPPTDDGDPGDGSVSLSEHAVDVCIKLKTNDGEEGGTVILRLAYKEFLSQDELLNIQQESGNLGTALLTPERKHVKYRFQAATAPIARNWLAAIRWLSSGCPQKLAPRDLYIPKAPLAPDELERISRDVSLIDLPFSRCSFLLHGLYNRRVMGPHKPTLRWIVYTIFQIEMHAWSVEQKTHAAKANKKRRKEDDLYSHVVDLKGLHFITVLERLTMLHYGKRSCLSYAEQAAEYELELNHVALQIIQTCVSSWIFRKRVGRTIGGHTWPWHPAWGGRLNAYG